jgi:hypothetical protein
MQTHPGTTRCFIVCVFMCPTFEAVDGPEAKAVYFM